MFMERIGGFLVQPSQSMATAKKFWKQADMEKLAEHWRYDEKLPYEIHALIPHLIGSRFIWDAACGNKRIANALKGIFRSVKFLCSDIKEWDLEEGVHPQAESSDTVLLMGVLPYLSDDTIVSLMDSCKDKKIIIRTPIGNGEHICKESLGGEYEAIYRTWHETVTLLNSHHQMIFHGRFYPKHLESEFGTEQTLFVVTPCK